MEAAQKFKAAEAPQPTELGGQGTTASAPSEKNAAIPEDNEDDDEEVDETGVEEKDIELVMSQVGNSRNYRVSHPITCRGFSA